jgi:large conductance mechanosensitive channel
MQNFIKEFKAFIASGNLVEIAVGLILALKVSALIDGFMEGIVNRILAAIFGKPNFDTAMAFDLGKSRIQPGLAITPLIDLILTGLVLFMIVKAYNKMKAKNAAEAPAGPTEVELLTEIRDSLKTRG